MVPAGSQLCAACCHHGSMHTTSPLHPWQAPPPPRARHSPAPGPGAAAARTCCCTHKTPAPPAAPSGHLPQGVLQGLRVRTPALAATTASSCKHVAACSTMLVLGNLHQMLTPHTLGSLGSRSWQVPGCAWQLLGILSPYSFQTPSCSRGTHPQLQDQARYSTSRACAKEGGVTTAATAMPGVGHRDLTAPMKGTHTQSQAGLHHRRVAAPLSKGAPPTAGMGQSAHRASADWQRGLV